MLFGYDLYHHNTLTLWDDIRTVSIWRAELFPVKAGFGITPQGENLSRRDTIVISWFMTNYKQAMVALYENMDPAKVDEEAARRIEKYRDKVHAA